MSKSRSLSNIRKVTVCAVMMALAFGLSFVPLAQMPLGGKITLFSMLPICFVAIKYGVLWGLGTAFCYSWLQVLQGGVFAWGLTPGILIASLLLDYIVAFTVLGLAGVFGKKKRWCYVLGTIFACVLRFVSHFVSGVVLWAEYDAFEVFGISYEGMPVLYSLFYNGFYMI
ncbi:MAG: energy-coupled thiamine transporter ThiT, partial [Clostridia bacterium]|nr:energy-coupled thiamine transporter ThiT [Clostridia bacterium]